MSSPDVDVPLAELSIEGASTNFDLDRFREEWQKEVQARRKGHAEVAPPPAPGLAAAQAQSSSLGRHVAATSPRVAAARLPSPSAAREARQPVQKSPATSPRATRPRDLDEPAAAHAAAVPAAGSDSAHAHGARRHRHQQLPSQYCKRPALPRPGLPPSAAQVAAAGGDTGQIPFPRFHTRDRAVETAAETEHVQDRAVTIYARAVKSEQSGRLNEALLLYRRAFKLDDGVDRLYTRALANPELVEPAPDTPTSVDVVSAAAPAEEAYSFQRHIQMQPDYEKTALHVQARRSVLSSMFAALPIPVDALAFLPEDEALPVHLAKLPAEVVDHVLAYLDVANIERFGQACWRARHLTATSSVWKRLVERVYRAPSMLPGGVDLRDMAARHGGEWRTTLVEEERVRMDGCYISVCHYMRR